MSREFRLNFTAVKCTTVLPEVLLTAGADFMLLQDANSLKQTVIKVHVYGPVSLGSPASSSELIVTLEGSVEAVWAGNDTTGQPNAQSARAGGRTCLEIPAESLKGTVTIHLLPEGHNV